MNFLGIALIALGTAIVCMDYIETGAQLRDLKARDEKLKVVVARAKMLELALYKSDQPPAYKPAPEEENRFAIRDFDDRDAQGRLVIPDTNPHTNLPIVWKWTAAEDSGKHVIYGPRYAHKPKTGG